ncbi:MAG: tetratricopeptide repeat protein [Planctomycetota bacterium]
MAAAGLIFWVSGGPRWILHGFARTKFEQRDYEAAERLLNWCNDFAIPDGETFFLEARLRRKQLQVSDVPKLLQKAADRGFDKERLKLEYMLLEAQTGRLQSVATELNQRLQTDSTDGREICEAYVNGSLMLGSYAAAQTIFDAWETEYPDDPQPHYLRSRIYEHQQNMTKATEQLLTALSKNVRHWPTRYALSRIAFDQNKFDEGLSQIESATMMKHNAAPMYQKARCLRGKAQLDEASQILREIANRPRAEVLKSFALVAQPERGYPIEYELGLIESALNNHQEAVRWLDLVLEHEPNHLDARYARALSLREVGESEKAESELKEVNRVRNMLLEVDRLVDLINESPDEPHVEARCRIGELLLKYKDARQGEYWLHDALNHDPNHIPAHQFLLEYYEKLAKTNPEWSAVADEHRRRTGVQ